MQKTPKTLRGIKNRVVQLFLNLFTSIPSQSQSQLLCIFSSDSLLEVVNIVYSLHILLENSKPSQQLVHLFMILLLYPFAEEQPAVKMLCCVLFCGVPYEVSVWSSLGKGELLSSVTSAAKAVIKSFHLLLVLT